MRVRDGTGRPARCDDAGGCPWLDVPIGICSPAGATGPGETLRTASTVASTTRAATAGAASAADHRGCLRNWLQSPTLASHRHA